MAPEALSKPALLQPAGHDLAASDRPGEAVGKPPRLVEKHFPALDGLRGTAVLLVFFYHYGGGRHSSLAVIRAVGFLCSLGWTGVTLFFLLSGFLITGLLWETKGQVHWFRNFYIRRALRILPLYYGTLALLMLCPFFDHSLRFHDVGKVAAIHALYLQNLPLFNYEWKQIWVPFSLEHYWTLAVEEQFYLLWPLLLFLIRTRRQGILLCVSIFVFSTVFNLVNQTVAVHPAALWHSLQGHAGELALGGALSLTYRTSRWAQVKRVLHPVGIIAGAVFLVGMVQLRAPGRDVFFANTYGLAAITIALGALLSAMLEPGILFRLATQRWLRWLGKISFGVYIFHLLPALGYDQLTRWMTGHDGDNVFGITRMFVVAVLTLLIAWLSFRFYESRFLKLKDRLAPHRVPPARLPR